jgi:hypothetical protein
MCLHDPGPRVEPDAVPGGVRPEGLSQAPERSVRRCGAQPRKRLLRRREATDPLERGPDVLTEEDGRLDVAEGDGREARRIQDPVNLRRLCQRERIGCLSMKRG